MAKDEKQKAVSGEELRAYKLSSASPRSEGGRKKGGRDKAAVKTPLRCPQCGAELKSGDIFCTSCGTPVPDVRFEDVPEPGWQEKAAAAAEKASERAEPHSEPEEAGEAPEEKASGGKRKLPPGLLILAALLISIIIVCAALIAAGLLRRSSEPEIVTGEVDSSQDYNNPDYEAGGHAIGEESPEPLPEEDIPALCADIDSQVSLIEEAIGTGECIERQISGLLWSYTQDSQVLKLYRGLPGDDVWEYYFSEGQLIYAVRSSSDIDKYYFSEGLMQRWLRLPSGGGSREYKDSTRTPDYIAREQEVLMGAIEALEEAKAAPEESPQPESASQDSEKPSQQGEYMLPGSDSRYIKREELESFTAEQCMIARNEIFARHGRKFLDAGLQRHFNSLSWYRGTVEPEDFDSSVFNDFELYNIDLIVKYERDKGYS